MGCHLSQKERTFVGHETETWRVHQNDVMRMRRILPVIVGIVLSVGGIETRFAAQMSSSVSFEVASVKVRNSGGGSTTMRMPHGFFLFEPHGVDDNTEHATSAQRRVPLCTFTDTSDGYTDVMMSTFMAAQLSHLERARLVACFA